VHDAKAKPGRPTRSRFDKGHGCKHNVMPRERVRYLVMRAARSIFLFCAVAAVLQTAFSGRTAGEDIPEIKASDNRLPRGRLKDGVLTIELEARVGVWYPEERDGPSLQVQAFAEAGQAPEIPGPMIRVPEGSEISVDIRNAIPGATLVIHGFHIRPGSPDDTLQLTPGGTPQYSVPSGHAGHLLLLGNNDRKGSSRSLRRR
jgi:FtsP/CotA-like multicopper oxidase with cupredoxin domain